MPKTRLEFWQAKFDRNIERDAENVERLQALGWRVATIWQCEIERGREMLDTQIEAMLHSARSDKLTPPRTPPAVT